MVLLLLAFVKLNTAISVQKKGEEYLVADGYAVALSYVRSGALLMDLLTIVPTIAQVSNPSEGFIFVLMSRCTRLLCKFQPKLPRAWSIHNIGTAAGSTHHK